MKTIRPMIISVTVMLLIVFLVIHFYPKNQLFTGYIVYKEYSKSMGIGKQPEVISEAMVSPSEFIKEIDKPTSGVSQFKIWVANKDKIERFEIPIPFDITNGSNVIKFSYELSSLICNNQEIMDDIKKIEPNCRSKYFNSYMEIYIS